MNLQGDKIVKKEDSMLLSDPFEKLKLLLDQGEFELLEDEEEKNKGNRYRLVYLMNDAVESFLVLENGRMTGEYQREYDGEIEAELREYEGTETFRETTEGRKKKYVLTVHQGESVCTLLFTGLKEEVSLYNYGEIGHFWVKGMNTCVSWSTPLPFSGINGSIWVTDIATGANRSLRRWRIFHR